MATTYILESGDPYIRRRTEKGWTLDFVFNKDGYDWVDGSVFYYWGISGETVAKNYADNNLSFSFTDDGKIVWKSIRFSPKYNTTGYTNLYLVTSGTTPTLCDNGTSNDFNLTITFKRNYILEDCDLENNGGINDLILSSSVSGSHLDWITGATLTQESIEVLNKKWYKEKKSRLGTLKFYLNGNPIYKIDNWEEIIPSKRESTNSLIQSWGSGTTGIQNIHTGFTQFDLKNVEYYEEPLDAISIKNNYITKIKPNYDITECDVDNNCFDSPNQNVDLLITQDGEFIQYF